MEQNLAFLVPARIPMPEGRGFTLDSVIVTEGAFWTGAGGGIAYPDVAGSRVPPSTVAAARGEQPGNHQPQSEYAKHCAFRHGRTSITWGRLTIETGPLGGRPFGLLNA